MENENSINLEEYEKAKALGILKLVTLTVTYDHYKAELTADYWWSSSGGLLYGYAKQYRVSSNGNRSGNIIFGVVGHDGQTWLYELTGSANQDGEWHDIGGGGWVTAPKKSGHLYFKYIFDRSGSYDPAAETSLNVSYP